MAGSFSLNSEFGGCTQVSSAPKIRRREARRTSRADAIGCAHLVSFFTIQIRVSPAFVRNALAVAAIKMYYKYILMVELRTEGVTCDPDKVLRSFPAPADLPGAA